VNDEEEKLPRRGVATVTTSQHTRRPSKKHIYIYINDRIPRAPAGAGIDLGRAAPAAAAAAADRRRRPPRPPPPPLSFCGSTDEWARSFRQNGR